jgi:hypothetical protein
MHPTDNSVLNAFSPCSISSMCSGITSRGQSCLVTPGSLRTITAGICGNGIVEGDEQCDCGSEESCAASPCCQEGCTLTEGSVCDDANDGCCETCQLRSTGTVCRESLDPCTLVQTCSGADGTCAESVRLEDKAVCELAGETGTTCASGICTSRTLQCRSSISSGSLQTVEPCPGQDGQCQLRCETPGGTCLQLNGNFIDGMRFYL